MADGQLIPDETQKTMRQAAQAGVAVFGLQGNGDPSAGTYRTYREIMADPTIALCRAIISGPIYANSWTFEAKDDDTPDEWVESVKNAFETQRPSLLAHGLRAVDYGWSPFEAIWGSMDGQIVPTKFKPLLVDITEIKVDEYGAFAGLKNGKAELDPLYALVFSYDGEAGNLYGRSRLENIRRKVYPAWATADERAAQLSAKAAAIIPIVHYPDGKCLGPGNREMSNFEAAQTLLNSLSTGKGICISNLFASSNDPREAAELAGKSQWVISFLEAAGAASSLAGMTERQRYLDSLKVRGMLRPERAVIEAQTAGSRADSTTAADAGLLDSMRIDEDFCQCLTWHAVDKLLEVNFGEAAKGNVIIKPAPLADESKAVFGKLFDAVVANPGTLEETLLQTDMDAVFDALKIPKSSAVITYSPAMNATGAEPLTPEQSQRVSDDQQAANEPLQKADAAGLPVSDLQLNGAQITAAVDVIEKLRNGIVNALVAIELLIAVGIPEERARRMVSSTTAMPKLESNEPTPAGNSAGQRPPIPGDTGNPPGGAARKPG